MLAVRCSAATGWIIAAGCITGIFSQIYKFENGNDYLNISSLESVVRVTLKVITPKILCDMAGKGRFSPSSKISGSIRSQRAKV